MTADLSRTRVERGEVMRAERFGSLVELTVLLPHLAATAQPGEFAQLRCGPGVVPLLRRPFSVAWVEGDACGFVFEEVGAGTRLLGDLGPGDELEVLGPLGHGFTLDGVADSCIVISGGVGCAPFPLLIRRLMDRGVRDILVFSGAQTAARLYPAARFHRGETLEVRETTYDGTRGMRGVVTELLRELPDAGARDVYACGPNRMLAAVWDVLTERETRASLLEASLEAPMGCGFGTCLGCAIPAFDASGGSRWALCCSDGPVMPMSTVDWDAIRAMPGADVA